MKKKLLVLGMALICIFGMTACSGNTNETASDSSYTYGTQTLTSEDVIATVDQTFDAIRNIVAQGMESQYETDTLFYAALTSWSDALADVGEMVAVTGHEVSLGEDGIRAVILVDGSSHDAEVEFIWDENLSPSSITTNVQYSFGELMQNAALNTVLGMGTVFVILILICLIIACFGIIPKLQASHGGKKEEASKAASDEVAAAPVPAPAAPVETAAADLTDDYELVAVIAAAIAASEGATTTDGFVVRSIRRVANSRWKSNY